MNSEISKYTVSVYELIENNFDFGLKDYEIFDENYRPILNQTILDFYKFREIGYVNPIQWRDRLNQRMRIIMRNKYNALYKAKMTDFNPLFNVDMTETFTHEISNTGEENNNNESQNNITQNSDNSSRVENKNNSLALNSQFPSEEMTEDDLSDNVFVDNAQKNKNNNTETSTSEDSSETTEKNKSTGKNTSKTNTIETYTRKNVGSSAGLPFSKALIQLKEFYDKYQLDQQVINELQDLFIQVW